MGLESTVHVVLPRWRGVDSTEDERGVVAGVAAYVESYLQDHHQRYSERRRGGSGEEGGLPSLHGSPPFSIAGETWPPAWMGFLPPPPPFRLPRQGSSSGTSFSKPGVLVGFASWASRLV